MNSTEFTTWLAAQPGAASTWLYLEAQRRDADLFDDAHQLAARLVRRWAQSVPRKRRLTLVRSGTA